MRVIQIYLLIDIIVLAISPLHCMLDPMFNGEAIWIGDWRGHLDLSLYCYYITIIITVAFLVPGR